MKKKPINSNVMKTTYVFSILFGLLIIYLVYFICFEAPNIVDNSYNKRIDNLSYYVTKGNIYASDHQILAQTLVNKSDSGDEEITETRNYPFGELFCHVVGSSARGNYGLESSYNYELLTSSTNNIKKLITELSGDKNPGNSIVTTLDVSIQRACYDALGNYKGAAIVMNPKTGEIYAMVSKPGYDPNYVDSLWESITSSDEALLLNRATQGLYTPGSVFKLFTLYDYLTQNSVETVSKYRFTCKSSIDVDGTSISCSGHVWHGEEDLITSFANSCNCSFVNLSKSIDPDNFSKVCNKLLFNTTLPLEIDYKSSQFTLTSADSDFMKAQTVIGQGKTLVSPIHIALVMSAIANDGVVMQPRFVTAIEGANGLVIEKIDKSSYTTLFSEDEASTLKEYLRKVVTNGTAASLNSNAYTLYGKTGTAQIDNNGNVNSWFAGFFQYGEDTYTICVVAEGVNESYTPAKDISGQIINKIISK
ncbi:MAG: penicillin-binding protein 2 [Clostridiales bacterium]|nr:penicillin-binding protein 2 [Clostridiales bacterium]